MPTEQNAMTISGEIARKFAQRVQLMESEWERTINEAAVRIERAILLHLQRQDLEWEPLNPEYKKRKERSKSPRLSNKILIATAEAMQQLEIVDLDEKTKFIGWVRQAIHPESGEPTAQIMAVHEHGSDDGIIPQRELVGPSTNEVQDWFKQALRRRLKAAARGGKAA